MELAEKFKKWLDTNPTKELRYIQCKVIAEDFVIGFAEWCDNLNIQDYDNKTYKQILEIYKKEKGL